jgi:hypothetical protein
MPDISRSTIQGKDQQVLVGIQEELQSIATLHLRKARRTTGKRQKAKIKGEPVTVQPEMSLPDVAVTSPETASPPLSTTTDLPGGARDGADVDEDNGQGGGAGLRIPPHARPRMIANRVSPAAEWMPSLRIIFSRCPSTVRAFICAGHPPGAS